MKSLKQLWEENGEKPFWAESAHGYFYTQFVSPKGMALGWTEAEELNWWNAEMKTWTLCDDPTKPKMRVWRAIQDSHLGGMSYRKGDLRLSLPMNPAEHWEDVTESLAAVLKEYL
jgi:hypothetical protein